MLYGDKINMHAEEKELTPFFKILKIMWENKKFLILFNSIILVVSIIILLLLPNKYKSTALISIQSSQNTMSPLPSILKDLPLGIGGILGGGEADALFYLRLAQSRAVMDSLIEIFNLDSLYKTEYREDTYKAIKENLEIIDNEDGTISLSFIDENNSLASKITKKIFSLVQSVDIKIKIKQAKRFKEFIEKRAEEAKQKLSFYEDSLKSFSEKSRLLNLEAQIPLIYQFLADLETERIQLELQRDFLQQNSSSNNVEFVKLDKQLNIIKKKIKDVYSKRVYSTYPIDSLPKASLEYYRLFRKVKIQEAILEFLIPQVENANLEEKKNYSMLVLIDEPVPAEKKDSPHRLRTLILIIFISVTLSLIYIRLRDIYLLNRNQLVNILGLKK